MVILLVSHCLDVTWNKDQSRIRMGNATENLAGMRRTALNLLRRETALPKESIRRRTLSTNSFALITTRVLNPLKNSLNYEISWGMKPPVDVS